MRVSTCVVAIAVVFAIVRVTPAAGQWPSYPTPGIPRLPDGKPNLTAPAPRAADGKPDLSGTWRVDGSGHVNGFAYNVAQDLETEAVRPWARTLLRDRLLSLGVQSPSARCLPRGLPALNAFGPALNRIVQSPGLVLIISDGDGAVQVLRPIFTDGRTLPDDPEPTWTGYSIGRWDRETLIVTTAGFNERGWLDFYGHPQTESLRVTERFTRRDVGHMDYEMTLDDPKVFTRPVSMTMNKVLVPDTELLESVCENEKDAGRLVGGNGFRLSAEDLRKYAATYEFAPGRDSTVTAGDGFLFLQEGANGVKRALVPQSPTQFVFRDNGDGVEFTLDAGGAITQLVVHSTGNDRTGVRKAQGSRENKR